jgi:hypothetical protein
MVMVSGSRSAKTALMLQTPKESRLGLSLFQSWMVRTRLVMRVSCHKEVMAMDFPKRAEVCDLPYYTEPDTFYETRMRKGVRIRELRDYACRLCEKENEQLAVKDLKFAFLHLYPFVILIDGNNHEVTVKKYNGEWILSCSCKSWIFNQRERRCKHTVHMEQMMDGDK